MTNNNQPDHIGDVNKKVDEQLALDFAREVIGWDGIQHYKYDSEGYYNPVLVRQPYEEFDYKRVDDVLNAVKEWCDKHNGLFTIEYYNKLGWAVEIKQIIDIGEIRLARIALQQNLPEALMAATLEAERQRKNG